MNKKNNDWMTYNTSVSHKCGKWHNGGQSLCEVDSKVCNLVA